MSPDQTPAPPPVQAGRASVMPSSPTSPCGDPQLPPASSRQSGQGVSLGNLRIAKGCLRSGRCLSEAAFMAYATPADLDLALWNNLGSAR